jgi:hypothetical protein
LKPAPRINLIRALLSASRNKSGAFKQFVEGQNIDAAGLAPKQLERIVHHILVSHVS